MTNKKTGRPPKYSEEQMIEGIKIVQREGGFPTGDTVKKAMCDELGVPGGINAVCLDREVERIVKELERQRLNLLISALPSETLGAAKEIGLLVEAAILDHMGEQQDKLRILAGKKLAEQEVDLGNQRQQIRDLLSRIDRKDVELAELEGSKHKVEVRLELAVTEINLTCSPEKSGALS